MKTYTVLFAAVLLTVYSCNESRPESFTVQGNLVNLGPAMAEYPEAFSGDSIELSLYEVPFGGDAPPLKLDSVFVSTRDSSFLLQTAGSTTGLYDILIGNGPMIPLVNDRNAITININLTDKDAYYTVAGSPASEELREFIFGYSEKSNSANEAFKQLELLKLQNSGDSTMLNATDRKNRALQEVNDYIRQSVTKADHPVVAAFVLGAGSNTLPEAEYEAALQETAGKYPADSNISFLRNQFTQRKAQTATPGPSSWIGKPVPELTMPDQNGKNISLSSFRGKYVLVDFWASWCGPCRQENPAVVRAYNTFKDRNFTVLGVSLDEDKDKWLKAIEKDKLDWTHISDLAFWNSKSVEIFGFQGIPYNVLVDPQGIVVAESLRGSDLMNTLQKTLSGN